MTRDIISEFILRVPSLLHKKLKDLAYQNNCSLNSYCKLLLEKAIQAGSNDNAAWTDIVKYLTKTFKDNFVGLVLFGSVARNEANDASDVDLLVVLDNSCSLNREIYRAWDDMNFFSPENRIINPHFVHIKNNDESGSLWFEVALDGIMIEDKKNLIQKKMIELRTMIAENKVKRYFSYGHPYWVKG
jgi:predicted nucleotidyltransferase